MNNYRQRVKLTRSHKPCNTMSSFKLQLNFENKQSYCTHLVSNFPPINEYTRPDKTMFRLGLRSNIEYSQGHWSIKSIFIIGQCTDVLCIMVWALNLQNEASNNTWQFPPPHCINELSNRCCLFTTKQWRGTTDHCGNSTNNIKFVAMGGKESGRNWQLNQN